MPDATAAPDHLDDPWDDEGPDCPRYLPTPDEIARVAALIRDGWSEHVRLKRWAAGLSGPVVIRPVRLWRPGGKRADDESAGTIASLRD